MAAGLWPRSTSRRAVGAASATWLWSLGGPERARGAPPSRPSPRRRAARGAMSDPTPCRARGVRAVVVPRPPRRATIVYFSGCSSMSTDVAASSSAAMALASCSVLGSGRAGLRVRPATAARAPVFVAVQHKVDRALVVRGARGDGGRLGRWPCSASARTALPPPLRARRRRSCRRGAHGARTSSRAGRSPRRKTRRTATSPARSTGRAHLELGRRANLLGRTGTRRGRPTALLGRSALLLSGWPAGMPRRVDLLRLRAHRARLRLAVRRGSPARRGARPARRPRAAARRRA